MDWPAVEIRDVVPAEVRRVGEAYSRARPRRGGGTHVAVASAAKAVEADEPAVIVAEPAATAQPASPAGDTKVQVVAHPITADVNWNAIERAGLAAAPGAGWNAVVTVNGRSAVA